MTSDALKRAQRKYDAKRPKPVSVRFNAQELEILHNACRPEESLGQCIRRLVYERLY